MMHKFPDSIRIKCFWLGLKQLLQHFFHFIITTEFQTSQWLFQQPKKVKIGWWYVKTVWGMLKDLKFHIVKTFNSVSR